MIEPEPIVSLEYETTVSARGIAPANAVVEHVGASECRFRTIVLFDTGDTVEFFFGTGERVAVRGTIATRVAKGHRFVYGMRLDRMSAKEIDALSDALDDLDDAGTPETNVQNGTVPPAVDGLTRSSARIPVNFDIAYRTPAIDFHPAKAIDISTNGLMMSCPEKLIPGVPVELRFTLPDRRSAKELTLGARVVTRQEPLKGTFLYGLALTCLDNRQRNRLNRYVTAARESQTRR